MNVWMIVYKGQNGKWLTSIDFPLRAETRAAARKYLKRYPNLLGDGVYKLVKFTASLVAILALTCISALGQAASQYAPIGSKTWVDPQGTQAGQQETAKQEILPPDRIVVYAGGATDGSVSPIAHVCADWSAVGPPFFPKPTRKSRRESRKWLAKCLAEPATSCPANTTAGDLKGPRAGYINRCWPQPQRKP